MKKRLFLIIALLLLSTGCGKFTKEDALNKIEAKANVKSYILKGTMQIVNNEEKFDYGLAVNSYDQKYYKVSLVNQISNQEQVILKNDDGVYVITPALNKSFKFQSEWPNNSSQAYILESIVKDIKNDQNFQFEKTETGYNLKSTVHYPNNSELVYQKIKCDEKMNPEEIRVYDQNDNAKITVKIAKIDYRAHLNKSDFCLEDLVKEDEDNNLEPEIESSNKTIENIIYPLYIPSNTYLTNSEKIDLEEGNRVILTFSGEKNFVLVEEVAHPLKEFEIIPIYGDPHIMATSVAAVGANSVYFSVDQIDYYIASNEMSSEEMLNVAASLGNSTAVSQSK